MSQHCDPERSCSSIAPVGGTWSGWPSPRPPLGMPSQHHHVVAPSTCQPTEVVPSPLQPPRPTVMKCPPLLYTKATSLYVTLPNGVCSTDASRRAVSSWTASLYTEYRQCEEWRRVRPGACHRVPALPPPGVAATIAAMSHTADIRLTEQLQSQCCNGIAEAGREF